MSTAKLISIGFNRVRTNARRSYLICARICKDSPEYAKPQYTHIMLLLRRFEKKLNGWVRYEKPDEAMLMNGESVVALRDTMRDGEGYLGLLKGQAQRNLCMDEYEQVGGWIDELEKDWKHICAKAGVVW